MKELTLLQPAVKRVSSVPHISLAVRPSVSRDEVFCVGTLGVSRIDIIDADPGSLRPSSEEVCCAK